MEDKIRTLKDLISEYEDEVSILDDMNYSWENYGDPGSDPGLQFEQAMKIESAYKEIVEFTKTM